MNWAGWMADVTRETLSDLTGERNDERVWYGSSDRLDFQAHLRPSEAFGEVAHHLDRSFRDRLVGDSSFTVPRCFRWNTARTKAPSSKLQAPKKLQISNSKPERGSGHPGRCVEVWGLELLWSLGFGASHSSHSTENSEKPLSRIQPVVSLLCRGEFFEEVAHLPSRV